MDVQVRHVLSDALTLDLSGLVDRFHGTPSLTWWDEKGNVFFHHGPVEPEQFNDKWESNWSGLDLLTCDGNQIRILISANQLCCELWGAALNGVSIHRKVKPHELEKLKEELERLHASEILDVRINIKREKLLRKERNYDDEREGMVCVDIQTSNETFEMTLFNQQNGYYSHSVVLQWRGHDERTSI